MPTVGMKLSGFPIRMVRYPAKLKECLHCALPLKFIRSSLAGALPNAPARTDDVSIHDVPHPVVDRQLQVFTPAMIQTAERVHFV